MSTLIYNFGDNTADGGAELKHLLGGKGANLGEMSRLGLPVPPGFTITTEVCLSFFANDGAWVDGLADNIETSMQLLEERTGRQFGSSTNPLLVSVRSGAPVSMPGMMDTILNLGLNDATVEGLAVQTGNPRFAYDAYRRFVKMFGDVVLGIHYALFNRAETDFKKGKSDAELTVEDMKGLIAVYKRVIRNERLDIPDSPKAQLRLAIDAVFNSLR